MSATFWNEAIETMCAPDVRRLEDDRLAEQIAYDYGTSPYYRARLDAAGVRPADVRHREDLERIPFMEKTEIAESQADGALLGVNQYAPLDRIVRIQATGGTTGQPMRIGLTRRDIVDYCEMGARALPREAFESHWRTLCDVGVPVGRSLPERLHHPVDAPSLVSSDNDV